MVIQEKKAIFLRRACSIPSDNQTTVIELRPNRVELVERINVEKVEEEEEEEEEMEQQVEVKVHQVQNGNNIVSYVFFVYILSNSMA